LNKVSIVQSYRDITSLPGQNQDIDNFLSEEEISSGKKKMYLAESINEIKQYRSAALRTGKEWFIEYYVYSPDAKKMARKKIKINHIEKISDRRQYANAMIKRLNVQLENGWNPFIQEQNSKSYSLLTAAIDSFLKLNRRKFEEGEIRDETIAGYESYMKMLKEYMKLKKCTDMYVYHFNKDFIIRYLDYIYYDLGRKSQTRDNYLAALRVFSSFLVDRGYVKVRPSEGIAVLGKRKREGKNRIILTADIQEQVKNYMEKNNPHFFLAAQILYFCMIRPKEMSYIQIKHIDTKKGVIFVPGESSKNHKDGVVTMPLSLCSLFEELGVLNANPEYYLFSDKFRPGSRWREEKQFRDYWNNHVRKDLKLPDTIKFYSLKDTGITNMIRRYNDPLIARDQARHSSLEITNNYTPQDMLVANEKIKNDTVKF